MKDDTLPKIVLFSQPPRTKLKTGRSCLGWEDLIKKDLKEMVTSQEGVKKEALNGKVWSRSVRSCVGLKRLGVSISF